MTKKIYDKGETGDYTKSTSSSFAYRGSSRKNSSAAFGRDAKDRYTKDPTLAEGEENTKSTSREPSQWIELLMFPFWPFRVIIEKVADWIWIGDEEKELPVHSFFQDNPYPKDWDKNPRHLTREYSLEMEKQRMEKARRGIQEHKNKWKALGYNPYKTYLDE